MSPWTRSSLRGLVAGLAAAGVMSAVDALVWLQWGLGAVFEWQEMQAVSARLLGRRSMRAALALHILFGGVVGIACGVRLAHVAPALVLGLALGFGMWVMTLLIHVRVTGSPHAASASQSAS